MAGDALACATDEKDGAAIEFKIGVMYEMEEWVCLRR